MKPKSFFQSLENYLDWYHQPPGKFIPLRPGCDLASIILEREEEIRKLAEDERKQQRKEVRT